MDRSNNYIIQAQQAKRRFTTYDQSRIIAKLKLRHDKEYLYTAMLSEAYRIHRETGEIFRETENGWIPTEDFGEVMTLLDLLCDSHCSVAAFQHDSDIHCNGTAEVLDGDGLAEHAGCGRMCHTLHITQGKGCHPAQYLIGDLDRAFTGSYIIHDITSFP